MTIQSIDYSNSTGRFSVQMVGDEHYDDFFSKQLNFFGYSTNRKSVDELSDDDLSASSAILFIKRDLQRASTLSEELYELIKKSLNNGCLFFLIVSHEVNIVLNKNIRTIAERKTGKKSFPLASIFPISRIEIEDHYTYAPSAYLFADYPNDGISENFLERTVCEVIKRVVALGSRNRRNSSQIISGKLNEEKNDSSHKYLLSRAFHDIHELRSQQVTGGKSGATTYKVFGRTEAAHSERVFFAKIDSRERIFQEWSSFRSLIEPTTPFHLTPNIHYQRCELGSTKGILVWEVIEGAESLSDCVNGGRSTKAVATLMAETLGSISKRISPIRQNNAVHLLCEEKKEIIQQFIEKTKCELKEQILFDALIEKFDEVCSEQAYNGVIHGDLHAENILVRNSDAVLIDFYKAEHGPLLFDHATLEISLAFRFCKVQSENESACKVDWKLFADKLFSDLMSESLNQLPRSNAYYANWQAIEQIRKFARSLERSKGQYARILAVKLIEHCGYKEENAVKAWMNCHALRLANDLLSHNWQDNASS